MQLIVFLHENSVKVHQLKAKESEINSYPLSLGNISKGFTVGNMKKKSLNGKVWMFQLITILWLLPILSTLVNI